MPLHHWFVELAFTIMKDAHFTTSASAAAKASTLLSTSYVTSSYGYASSAPLSPDGREFRLGTDDTAISRHSGHATSATLFAKPAMPATEFIYISQCAATFSFILAGISNAQPDDKRPCISAALAHAAS